LLWASHFLKTYGTESTLASQIGVDEKTFRKWTWILVYAIADLAPEVVSVKCIETIFSSVSDYIIPILCFRLFGTIVK